ncbi:MAG: DUF4215 domain-containing protein, partial [Deltaproteobacteria bacterium]|nr:DUF4215 domain-containing protein [Deltaproteobacteria bacterium]
MTRLFGFLSALSLIVIPGSAFAQVCGDSILDVTEACDDGGLAPGDGCDALCAVETGFDCTGPVDFNLGTQSNIGNSATWSVAADGLSATQSINGFPSLFVVPVQASVIGTFTFDITVNTTGDDDFFGVAVGIDPMEAESATADFLLVDWKQGNQVAYGAGANAGLAVSRVTGAGDNAAYWGHTGVVSQLQRGATLSGTGWNDNQTYSIQLDFTTTSLEVSVDGVLELSITGEFSDGGIAIYNFSQSNVNYVWTSAIGSICSSSCGDGALASDEGCDDGGLDASDGCSSICTVEPGWICAGDPSVCDMDSDADGVGDLADNCLNTPNPGQLDGDGDGAGDLCDVCPLDNPDDTDGDGGCDSVDPCPLDNPDDTDGDGVCDGVDLCLGDDATGDTDGDGICGN